MADNEAWDLGQGAGFYVNATQGPWAPHYRMADYVTQEVVGLLGQFTNHPKRGITGHSMGGHGALVLALRNPELFHSVSAFAPIVNPSQVPWGQKAFSAYLGEDRTNWAEWDATALLGGGALPYPILVDQGTSDSFLATQLEATAFSRCRGGRRTGADLPTAPRLRP